jgi:hypothetical protein
MKKKEVPMLDFDWFDDPVFDWMIIGQIDDELKEEEKEQRRIEKEDEEDY